MATELVDRDAEHLRILSIFHYAAAGVTALIGSFPLLHVGIGVLILLLPEDMRTSRDEAFPREMGVFFIGMGLLFVVGGWALAGLHFLIARFLKQQRHFWFCLAASAITCFACMFSSGVVGIATLVILLRPGVRGLFETGIVTQVETP